MNDKKDFNIHCKLNVSAKLTSDNLNFLPSIAFEDATYVLQVEKATAIMSLYLTEPTLLGHVFNPQQYGSSVTVLFPVSGGFLKDQCKMN